ncbi:DUF4181 domain-containing protein [Oceanobacillus kimchii]|uniref:DUF4181 domain-containing protein n=2 Tax=Bacillaceae TaxID=186817 RepID=A0ABQ5TIH0_9BACI|nr:DUF4181 domain-containing protein [Oceanobacillus kimchii]GLO65428.1 hypothetical protein MACH08_12120 [Oceanobacillus kimchii]
MKSMFVALVILISIVILSIAINKFLVKQFQIDIPESKERYVNRLHKTVEKVFHAGTLIAIPLTFTQFPQYTVFVFIIPAMQQLFRFLMEFLFNYENKRFILSVNTSWLLLIGAIVYDFYT